ncbi:MAG: hypothetical protein P1U87_14330 [Verrucomicrobiales bacterium]|nr:hypothetical protein [Verrucomicrobiales bacterium]
MKWFQAIGRGVSILFLLGVCQAELRANEAEVIALFEKAGARIAKNEEGHAIKLFSGGKPPHSVAELQRIGELKHLEQIALNSPMAGNEEWGFLRELPALKVLTIWHCKTISSLAPFSGLPIESLTVGGSMGLRDLNRETPEEYRDVVLTLKDLPHLKSVNLYHSPLVPGDEHLLHLVTEFPHLEEVKVDVNAPSGMETTMTPAGLKALAKIPVKVLSLENIHSFTAEHMSAIAEVKSLEAVLIDCRKKPFDTVPLVKKLKELRPELEVVVADGGAKGPPRRAKVRP